MSNQTYEYDPLVGNEIRLIHLTLPLQDFSTSGLVQYTLLHRDLDEKPEYTALSYAWGDPTITEPILLNGVAVQVTINLAAALRILPRSQEGYLWVDAICINQNDVEERGSQVEKMKDIYRHAKLVIVWLGLCSPTLRFALDKLKDLRHILQPAMDSLRASGQVFGWDDVVRNSKAELHRYMEQDSSEGKEFWIGLNEFYDLPWWERTWILQEVASANQLCFICGTLMVDLDWMKCRESCISTITQDYKVRSSEGVTYFRSRSVFKVLYLKETCELDNGLLNLLEWGRTSIATDPRDKVFAFLGLASDIPPGSLTPSYFFSTSRVYTDVVLWFISKYNNLEILGHCFPYHAEHDNVPSWVPDWSFRIYRPNPEHRFRDKSKNGQLTNAYNASKDSVVLKLNERIEDIVGNGRYLKLYGINLGTITLVSTSADDDLYLKVQKGWIPDNKEEAYTWTGETTDKAFLHTIVGDRCPALDIQRGFACAVDWAENITPREPASARVQNFTARRRFVVTDNGMMGVVPAGSLSGDSVFVLLGGSVLYVLRFTTEGRYMLIGEAYFHGMMDGEAMDLCNEGEFKLETIILE